MRGFIEPNLSKYTIKILKSGEIWEDVSHK